MEVQKLLKKNVNEYEEKIRKNPIDFQILGIGENGHIGFNEPGSDINSKTRIVELTHIKGNATYNGNFNNNEIKENNLTCIWKKESQSN